MSKETLMQKISFYLLIATIIAIPVGVSAAEAVIDESENYLSSISAKIYALPGSADALAGKDQVVRINLDPNGSTVCTVSGELYLNTDSFGSPYIKDVSAESVLKVQSLPSESDPSFYLTIPGCAKNKRKLLSITLGSYVPGAGRVTFGNLKLIGPDGKPVLSEGQDGTYTFSASSTSNLTAALISPYDFSVPGIVAKASVVGLVVVAAYAIYKKIKN